MAIFLFRITDLLTLLTHPQLSPPGSETSSPSVNRGWMLREGGIYWITVIQPHAVTNVNLSLAPFPHPRYSFLVSWKNKKNACPHNLPVGNRNEKGEREKLGCQD